jgi:hypothetical protein
LRRGSVSVQRGAVLADVELKEGGLLEVSDENHPALGQASTNGTACFRSRVENVRATHGCSSRARIMARERRRPA